MNPRVDLSENHLLVMFSFLVRYVMHN
uniref:Uncharacterized protein n=1 Tax=Arundo donax TaxID=35708 RepID=A0A0A9HHF7_ARUDO